MLTLIVIVVLAAALWRFGYWPFNGTYPQLPQYGVNHPPKSDPTDLNKPGL